MAWHHTAGLPLTSALRLLGPTPRSALVYKNVPEGGSGFSGTSPTVNRFRPSATHPVLQFRFTSTIASRSSSTPTYVLWCHHFGDAPWLQRSGLPSEAKSPSLIGCRNFKIGFSEPPVVSTVEIIDIFVVHGFDKTNLKNCPRKNGGRCFICCDTYYVTDFEFCIGQFLPSKKQHGDECDECHRDAGLPKPWDKTHQASHPPLHSRIFACVHKP